MPMLWSVVGVTDCRGGEHHCRTRCNELCSNRGNTIVDTCRCSNLTKKVTPTGNPLQLELIDKKFAQQPTAPILLGQEQPMRSTAPPSISTERQMRHTAVGILEQSSAIDAATNWIITLAIIHPHTIPPVPAYLRVNGSQNLGHTQGRKPALPQRMVTIQAQRNSRKSYSIP